MSWIKLNTLHWHVVDSQSFPIQVPSFPELSSKGAYGPNLIYSSADVQGIVSYAAARGVDILAEFDMPGHTAVIAESHPEHVACSIVGTTQDYNSNFANGAITIRSPSHTELYDLCVDILFINVQL